MKYPYNMIQHYSHNGRSSGIFIIIFLALALILCSCFLKQQAQAEPMQDMDQQKMLYICPMHPDESSDAPGSCSQCGMFLVARDGVDKADRSMHQHAETMTDDVMQHKNMSMPGKTKQVLFWESSSSQANKNYQAERIMDHQHEQSDQAVETMPKRMTAERPMMSNMPKQVNLKTQDEQAGKHIGAHYICPMHTQIVSKETDSSCPVCGMDLVLKDSGPAAAEQGHAQEQIYICPMHPQIVQDESGSCPICGMDLVSRENAAPAGDHPQVFLSAAVIQNMGVRIAKVRPKILSKQIRTQGIVTPDDDRMLLIHPRTGGWIEVLHLISEGDRIERKEVLVDFYSPWINQVQLDFITALEEYDLTAFDPGRQTELAAKVASLRNSLRLLNVMDMDIQRINNTRKVLNTIQLKAPQGGIVTRININEGSYVEPYQSMFTIVDLSRVWVMVDIYEYQAPLVRKGHKVKITAPAIPGRHWNGVVDFIYPEVDVKTRTLRARIEVPNPDEALLLNMFVQVDLSASAGRQKMLTVPRDAVIVTGEREVVIKSLGKGHFQPVDVSTGFRGNHQTEILSGLVEGDEVVVSGQFLIDSESSLQASFLRMME